MIRKITLLFVLFIGLSSIAQAQVLDSVRIYLPYGDDTSCPGKQLTFTAVQSNDTFSNVTYAWYTDNNLTGVIIDTFYTTALSDGDSVYCRMTYINSLGTAVTTQSNTIIIHRADTIQPKLHIALTSGKIPDCSFKPLTFTAYPVNGGPSPIFEWRINNAIIPGEDSVTFTRIFPSGDTISCIMISNSPCSAPYNDTVISFDIIPINHDSLTAAINIFAALNPICLGTPDSFQAIIAFTGDSAYSIRWFVDSVQITGAIDSTYFTDTLHNGDLVYAVLDAPDQCVINHETVSNVVTMTVIRPLDNSASFNLTAGANPGCLDSSVTFTATFDSFGINPAYKWYVNGVMVDSNQLSLDSVFSNGDIVSFRINETDYGCYAHDTIIVPNVLLIRDSTPHTPIISLIGDLLVAGEAGSYSWYGPPAGGIIAGAISATYHPTLLGTYYAIKDTSGCRSDTSNFIYISLLGVNNVHTTDVKIFPNPTSGTLNLDWGTQTVNMTLDVYNVQGQGLLHENIVNETRHETDLSYLPEGNYFIMLRDEDGSRRTFKVSLIK